MVMGKVRITGNHTLVVMNSSVCGIWRDFYSLDVLLPIWELKNFFLLKIMGAILAIELAGKNGWRNLWLECDYIIVVQAFREIIIWCLGS